MTRSRLCPIGPGMWPEVVAIFWDTFALGSPIPFRLTTADVYERLALDWYRDHPEPSRVAMVDGQIVGYVLVCLNHAAFEANQIRNGLSYLRHVLPLFTTPISRYERKFILSRLIDGFEAWRDEDPMAVGAHAHFNVAQGFRSGLLVKEYVEHIDAMCSEAGLTHWFGQMNARNGRRIRLLEEYGFTVMSARYNRTLSWMTRSEVQRITVIREIGSLERLPVAS